jgi:hypothetical protein
VSITVAALGDAYNDADLFETIRQIRRDEVDGAGTYELVHHNRSENRAEEETLGSSTRRKLEQLPIWDIYSPRKWRQRAPWGCIPSLASHKPMPRVSASRACGCSLLCVLHKFRRDGRILH